MARKARSKKAAAKPTAKPTAGRAAKAKTPAKPATKPKAKRASTKPAVTAKSRPRVSKRKAPPRRVARPESSTFDITRLIDHPLVADLLAVGAMAAVAAIADHNVKTRTGEAESGSSKAVKAAGKAAAAAVGKRLLTEVDAIKKASQAKDAKRGSR